ncbi:hypothetical protein M2192_008774 [Bradyrhizobium elkanii USDA 61]|nr:hypothetical protein [Bradyrhizobium elkanii]MCS3718106.1 hypothetical protein [Bradyrhizobium elkanii]MCS4011814.1 hypothetical protein [Bradyrhizobium elkanii USDA 61]BBB97672.1 hypothetical protein BE61_31060 [Bradyrhizobium elkanii USDA 61]
MPTEMGEYLVGAYLKLVLGCSVVDYNARPQGGGLQALGELDVIGFDFVNRNVRGDHASGWIADRRRWRSHHS